MPLVQPFLKVFKAQHWRNKFCPPEMKDNSTNDDGINANGSFGHDCGSNSTPKPLRYTYTPFRNKQPIRLLSLLPGSGDDPLRCTLHETELDKAPEYEAISYTWGDYESPASIACDAENKELGIPPNLKAALLRFRMVDKPRLLWTDSICVNQEDVVERSQQVKLMGSIYRKAATVLIWLGEEDENTSWAWYCMRLITQWIIAMNDGTSPETWPPPTRACLALEEILKRPWFYRAWTYQESVLAQEAQISCGSWCISRTVLRLIIVRAWRMDPTSSKELNFLRKSCSNSGLNAHSPPRPP
jgi:hypothetical protein